MSMSDSGTKSSLARNATDVAKTLVNGGVAGCCAKTVVAPMDRVKILLQAHNAHYADLSLPRAFMKVMKYEGLMGYYKGNGAQIVRIFPYAGVQFLSFETYKHLLHYELGLTGSYHNFLAGSMAGITSVSTTYPLDVVRARLAFQTKVKQYSGISDVIVQTVRNEGIGGLYRGFLPTIWGMIPYAGLSFFTFEVLKAKSREWNQNAGHGTTAIMNMMSGSVAGLVAQTGSYPFDVVRRRMQVEGMEGSVKSHYEGTVRSIGLVWRQEGFLALYRGLSLNYIKAVPQVSVSFTVYEFMKTYIFPRD
eukprot:Clim_evm23s218 gene=Clim_evmTU23s218